MAEFARYYVEFLWTFVQNLWTTIKTRVLALYTFIVTDTIGYFNTLIEAVPNFDVLGWIMLIVSCVINFTLLFFLIYRFCQLMRRYVFFRAKEVDKDKLMEEIAKLKQQANELTDEKKKIFALKVNSGLGMLGENATGVTNVENAQIVAGSGEGSTALTQKSTSTLSRFTKLINLDEQYQRNPFYVFMEEEDMLSLSDIVNRFVNFSASQLKLYYTQNTIRQFFAGLATSKIIILEGISGTGK